MFLLYHKILLLPTPHSTGIAASLPLPDTDEFDVFFPMQMTKRQNAEAKQLLLDKNQYKLIPSNTLFDYLPEINRKHDPLAFYYPGVVLRDLRFLEEIQSSFPSNKSPSFSLT